jgi:hypothetical protein
MKAGIVTDNYCHEMVFQSKSIPYSHHEIVFKEEKKIKYSGF